MVNTSTDREGMLTSKNYKATVLPQLRKKKQSHYLTSYHYKLDEMLFPIKYQNVACVHSRSQTEIRALEALLRYLWNNLCKKTLMGLSSFKIQVCRPSQKHLQMMMSAGK